MHVQRHTCAYIISLLLYQSGANLGIVNHCKCILTNTFPNFCALLYDIVCVLLVCVYVCVRVCMCVCVCVGGGGGGGAARVCLMESKAQLVTAFTMH